LILSQDQTLMLNSLFPIHSRSKAKAHELQLFNAIAC